MAKALQDNVREVLSRAVEEAARSAGNTSRSVSPRRKKRTSIVRSVLPDRKRSRSAPLAGVGGVLAGAGVAALAPVAVKGAAKLAKGAAMNGLSNIATAPVRGLSNIATAPVRAAEKVGSGVGDAVGGKLSQKIDESGGPSGILKEMAKSALPFGGGDDDDKAEDEGGAPGVGEGRRMPVQQSVDIGLPLETVYNQWTQFEEWPKFMHRVTKVTQEDDTTVSLQAKIWGTSKKFQADIETQHPDERIKWRGREGLDHAGVVTFHELGPNLTRVMLSFDVDPGGPLEKLARGARHIKRAARGDLHRFKAFIEMQGQETGAWRGVIDDGEVVEQHDRSYDEGREYFSPESGSDDQQRSRGSSRPRSRSGSQRSTRSRASASGGGRKPSSRSQRGSSGRSQGSSGRGQGSSGRGQGSSGRSQRASSRSGSSRNGSGSSSRSSSARSGSNGPGRSGGSSNRSSNRSGSATRTRAASRSRTTGSRSNGRG